VDGDESGRVFISEGLRPAIEGTLEQTQCFVIILSVLDEYFCHIVNSGENGRVVHSENLLSSIEGTLQPIKSFDVIPL